MNVIEADGIVKTYGKITALDGVSFGVSEGEMFGLIGPDGSGKTSLYKILATLQRADKGTARVCGLDTVKDYRAIRDVVGYMPEQFSLYPDLSVMENLKFFASLFGTTVKAGYDLIAPIFSQLGKFPNRRAGALSGGMKQKLALSCALIHRPRVLLLDEPTTGVDAVSRSEFWDMLSTLRGQGITIVVSTSYMDEASLCERIALIHNGRILGIDTPQRLVDNIGEHLLAASADNMYGLLEALRSLPGIGSCYTFGATIHAVAGKDFDIPAAVKALEAKGLKYVSITPVKGNIEDLFIKLMSHE